MNRIISLICIITLAWNTCFNGISYARSPQVGKRPSSELAESINAIDKFKLPASLGVINDYFDSGNPKTIIHIQDAHCNYDAQLKISQILEYLTTKLNIDIINLEGGEGEYDFSVFNVLDNSDKKEKVLDILLKEGVVSGAEYFAIKNPDKVSVFGIEDTDFYKKNNKLYRYSMNLKPEAIKILNELVSIVNKLKQQQYSEELIAFDEQYFLYKKENNFANYIDFLEQKALSLKISLQSYPNICLARKIKNNDFDVDKITKQSDTLIAKLSRMLTKEEIKQLTINRLSFIKNDLSELDYYNFLIKKALENKIDDKHYPELLNYTSYLKNCKNIKQDNLVQEIENLSELITSMLAANEEQKEIYKISKNIFLLEKLFNTGFTSKDYKFYKNNVKDFETLNIVKFIENEKRNYHLKTALTSDDIKTIDYYRKLNVLFYEYCFKRDRLFISNLQFNSNVSVVITGGFHSKNLYNLCKQVGLSYIAIIPEFSNIDPTNGLYFNLLNDKSIGLFKYLQTAVSTMAIYSYFCGENSRKIYDLTNQDLQTILLKLKDLVVSPDNRLELLDGQLIIQASAQAPEAESYDSVEKIDGAKISGKDVWAIRKNFAESNINDVEAEPALIENKVKTQKIKSLKTRLKLIASYLFLTKKGRYITITSFATVLGLYDIGFLILAIGGLSALAVVMNIMKLIFKTIANYPVESSWTRKFIVMLLTTLVLGISAVDISIKEREYILYFYKFVSEQGRNFKTLHANQIVTEDDASLNDLTHSLVDYSLIQDIVPDYSTDMILFDFFNRITPDGERVIGAYMAKDIPFFSIEFYSQLNTHDFLKILIWEARHKQKPIGLNIKNGEEVESLESVDSLSEVYRILERYAEPDMYFERIKDYETLAHHYFKIELGVTIEEFIENFDHWFDLIWNDAEKTESIAGEDKDTARDFALMLAIYQSTHRWYDDSYLVEGVTNATVFEPTRKKIGKPQDASLGAFQGYETQVARALSDNPELLSELSKSKSSVVRELSEKWKGFTKEEISADLDTIDFLFGAKSPVFDYWELSLMGSIRLSVQSFIKTAQGMKIDDSNLRFSLALSELKSKAYPIRHYIRKEMPKLLNDLGEGEAVRIPYNRAHIYSHVLEILNDAGILKGNRKLLFYYSDQPAISYEQSLKMGSNNTALIGKLFDLNGNIIPSDEIFVKENENMLEFLHNGEVVLTLNKAYNEQDQLVTFDTYHAKEQLLEILNNQNGLTDSESVNLQNVISEKFIPGEFKVVGITDDVDINGCFVTRQNKNAGPQTTLYLSQSLLDQKSTPVSLMGILHEFGESDLFEMPDGVFNQPEIPVLDNLSFKETISRHTYFRGVGDKVRTAYGVLFNEIGYDIDNLPVNELLNRLENLLVRPKTNNKLTLSEKALIVLNYNQRGNRNNLLNQPVSMLDMEGIQGKINLQNNLEFTSQIVLVKNETNNNDLNFHILPSNIVEPSQTDDSKPVKYFEEIAQMRQVLEETFAEMLENIDKLAQTFVLCSTESEVDEAENFLQSLRQQGGSYSILADRFIIVKNIHSPNSSTVQLKIQERRIIELASLMFLNNQASAFGNSVYTLSIDEIMSSPVPVDLNKSMVNSLIDSSL